MLKQEQMKEQVNKYQIEISEWNQTVYLLKPKGQVKLSTARAIAWVEAGIDDLDCRSKEQMLEILKSWL